MQNSGKYIGYAVLWLAVTVVIVLSHNLASKHRATHRVESIDIEFENQGSNSLVDRAMVEGWIDESGLMPLGHIIDSVDIARIEQELTRHSVVAEANAYITFNGSLKLHVRERMPVARLRTTGYDLYITQDGYVLPAHEGYSVRVPVITGDYTPVFSPDYSGYISDMISDTIASLDRHIAELEEAKIPLYTQINDHRRAMRSVTSETIRKGIFMSEQEFSVLKQDLDERKNIARSLFRDQQAALEAEIAILAEAQEATRRSQQTLRTILTDLEAMIAMFAHIEQDDFLRAEVVQVIATNENNGALSLSLIPRSGRFTVDLGTTEGLIRKLSTLKRFYDNGLDNVGWNRYRSISLRYRGQVVCQ